MKVCILGSSGGFALDYLMLAMRLGVVDAEVNRVVTDRQCRTVDVAHKHRINCVTIQQDLSLPRKDYSNLLLEQVPSDTDLIVISLKRLIDGDILTAFDNRILNTHPSLLPAYPGYGANKKLLTEGKGLFGGCSCHLVNNLPDDGPMVIQSVLPLNYVNDQREWELNLWHHQKHNLSQAVQFFAQNRVELIDGRVLVKDADYGGLPTNPGIEEDFSVVDEQFVIK